MIDALHSRLFVKNPSSNFITELNIDDEVIKLEP